MPEQHSSYKNLIITAIVLILIVGLIYYFGDVLGLRSKSGMKALTPEQEKAVLNTLQATSSVEQKLTPEQTKAVNSLSVPKTSQTTRPPAPSKSALDSLQN